jgi:hypothetical protein
MAEVDFARFARVLEDPAYVAVGFGVLGFQRAQVYRRALQRRLSQMAGGARSSLHAPPRPALRRPTLAEVMLGAAARGARTGSVGPLVRDVAGLAAGRVGPLVADASQRIGPLVADASQRIGPLVADASQRIGPLVADAALRLAPLVSDAAESVAPVVGEAAEDLAPEAKEFLDAAGELVNDVSQDARELAKEAVAFGRFAIQMLGTPARRPS